MKMSRLLDPRRLRGAGAPRRRYDPDGGKKKINLGLQGGGAQYYPGDALAGRETARLVTSWATGPAEIRAFLDLIARAPLPASP